MKKLSLALLLTVGCTASNAATINPYEPRPTPICIEGARTLLKAITTEPKKIFGENAGISRLPDEERARAFVLTALTLDKAASSEESICSISISANPELPEADKNKIDKTYPPTRVKFKVQKTDGEPTVSLISFTKINP